MAIIGPDKSSSSVLKTVISTNEDIVYLLRSIKEDKSGISELEKHVHGKKFLKSALGLNQ